MSLKSNCELPWKVRDLTKRNITPGLEVVRWQKVEPVGGISYGYLERYSLCFYSLYSYLGIMLYMDYSIIKQYICFFIYYLPNHTKIFINP